MAKNADSKQLNIVKVEKGRVSYCIVGSSPLILNRMSEKAKHELFLPKGKKTKADKEQSLKHDPRQEFLACPYMDNDPKAPTLLQGLAAWFKVGMANAAIDVPGAEKSKVGRLMWVLGDRVGTHGRQGDRIALYGKPQMKIDIVRNSDMNRTPDVRTRVILPRWAVQITCEFIKPSLNEQSISNLLISAGMTMGVGEWRVGKGKGTYGCYDVVDQGDEEFVSICKEGRKVQLAAMQTPEFYDEETEDLYRWYENEVRVRGKSDLLSSNGKPRKAMFAKA